MTIAEINFSTYEHSVKAALQHIGADKVFAGQTAILLKPNLVNDAPHPVTTPANFCGAVIKYIRSCSDAQMVIAEGCGDAVLETTEVFDRLGYTKLSKQYDIPLIDLNDAPLKTLTNKKCSVFPKMHLPEIAFTHFIISLPVLKAHSLAVMTGTLKNMMGFAPPQYYSGKFGIWKKAVFHENMHQSIIDLNRYITPDLTIMDASIGLAEYHLGGRQCRPPVNKILAGLDPVQVDRRAAELLYFDWKNIMHLK